MATQTDFAAFLRQAREKAGLTQSALADKCRLTGSYISLLESGKKPAPSDRVVRRLASTLGLPAEEALEIAHLDRAPDDLRNAVERLRKQVLLEQALRQHTAESIFPFSLWNLLPANGPARHRGGVVAGFEAEALHAIDHLIAMVSSAPDLTRLQLESRKVLDGLPKEKRRQVLDAIPAFVARTGGKGVHSLVPAPEPGLPPDIRAGDILVLDTVTPPAPGDVVLAGEPGKPALRVFREGEGAVAGVVVEVRRRLK